MADIFVSYKSTDRDRVAPIVALLEAHGWSVWWDRRIDAGEQWDEAIEREIVAASCVVAIWSCESVSSRWVRTEAAEGLERGILVPVLIDATKPPLQFKRVQSIDLTGWRGKAGESCAKSLLCAVARFLAQPTANAGRVPGEPQVHRQQASLRKQVHRHLGKRLRDWGQLAAYLAGRCTVAAKARIERLALRMARVKGAAVSWALAGALIVVVPFALWLWLTDWSRGLPPVAQPLPRPPPPSAGEMRLANHMLAQGERLLERGSIDAARMNFQFAAEYVAEGAFRLAETHDPLEFSRLEAIGVRPDPGQARDWYERARDLGHPEAEKRLKRLKGLAPS